MQSVTTRRSTLVERPRTVDPHMITPQIPRNWLVLGDTLYSSGNESGLLRLEFWALSRKHQKHAISILKRFVGECLINMGFEKIRQPNFHDAVCA